MSHGLREKIYDEQIPGFTLAKVPVARSNGGILVDVCCLLAAYLIPWALASGRMFQDYQSLMIIRIDNGMGD